MGCVWAADVDRDSTRTVDVREIIITASPKDNARLESQPLASSTLHREQLNADRVTSIKRLTAVVPNFYMPDYGSRLTSAVYIRGVGSRINTPAIGLYVDNIPYLDKSAFDFDTYDIERIDILRGPQSTLYGRNAMGGLMRIYTRNPFRYQGTQLSLSGATGDASLHASLTHYHRISRRFAFSAGGFYGQSRGFYKNENLGGYADGSRSAGGRMRAIWLPSEHWKLDATANYEYSDEGGYAYRQWDEPTATALPIRTGTPGSYRRGLANAGLSATRQGERLTFNSVTSYQRLDDRMYMDQDFLPEDRYVLEQRQRLDAFTQELSLKNNDDARWQWVTGAFAAWQNLRTSSPVTFGTDGMQMLEDIVNENLPSTPPMQMGIDFTEPAMKVPADFTTPTTSLALFHQSTLHDILIPGLSATIGLRVDHERLRMDYASGATAAYDFTINMLPRPLSNTGEARLEGRIKDHYTRLLPRFALQYDLPSMGNIYLSAAKGYRSGGYNIQLFSDLSRFELQRVVMEQVKEGCIRQVEQLFPDRAEMIASMIEQYMPDIPRQDVRATYYKPEYTWSYEAGAHLALPDGTLRGSIAAFLMDTRDQQIARMAESGMGRQMVNAGRSRSLGLEMEAQWQPHVRWMLNASYGYTRATFRQYDSGAEVDNDYTGRTVPFVPRHTLNTTAAYTLPLEHSLLQSMTLRVGYSAVGHTYWDEANTHGQGFYGTFNSTLTLRLPHCEAAIWGSNLAGRTYYTFGVESLGRWFVQPGKPRQMGIDLRFNI